MSPDAEYGSASPEPGFEQDESGIMAEEKIERESTEEKSPSQGDERPCLRCIKRGLQDQCHDGVRKKAKYLHDAPPDALMPGFAGHYHVNGVHHLPTVPGASQIAPNGMPVSQPGNYYPPNTQANYAQYGSVGQPSQMGPPLMDNNNLMNEFATQQNVNTPPQFQPTSSQQVSPVQDMSNTLDTTNAIGHAGTGSFDSSFLDPNDPSLFNFNISDLNFGNHYGALEFGMLGHMSSGAVGTPEIDVMNPMGQAHQGSISYDGSTGFQGSYGFNQTLPAWQGAPNAGSRQDSITWASQGNGMEAYAIGEQSSLTGQSPQSQDFSTGYSTSPETHFAQPDQSNQQELLRQSISQAQQMQRRQGVFPGNADQDFSRKRRRDTAEIYSSVQAPYSYTQGFHALTAFLQKRFPSKKVLAIAKALATIRPSFISCNQNLNRDDLIFMEKCFQRTLCEYEDFVNHYGTPTIICRRTGEIAAVSKEFSLVTGWRRDVLLGKEPNLNVNTGANSSGTRTGSSSRGAATPRMLNVEADPGRPQPVFLAELLDEDSVVQFYEDFAELAFGASRTSIIGAPCSLLKYRTKNDPGWGPNDHLPDVGSKRTNKVAREIKNEPLIRGEAGMNALGERDGRVDCSMCWTVKRDTFDIPMLIVMNFLPII
ncbi:hypothetical protein LTR36_006485 [Oleoguttula mirabilis]|uniref:ERT1/acuK family PAS domain-containing protein n=1 Tax=Oleoguttula mirabilis TaxID=1507867 RepID=A0AAV9JV97_9PEZI|nr:hypothetical protein LTR36_006485 [Oleoguttula mirabilis]